MLIETLPEILDGQLVATAQQAGALYCHLLQKADALIDPAAITAVEAERKVRAQLDFPKTKLTIHGQLVIITKAHVSNEATGLSVAFKAGQFLIIDELISPSGRRMSGQAFSNGYAAD